jgi:hypothetical protein
VPGAPVVTPGRIRSAPARSAQTTRSLINRARRPTRPGSRGAGSKQRRCHTAVRLCIVRADGGTHNADAISDQATLSSRAVTTRAALARFIKVSSMWPHPGLMRHQLLDRALSSTPTCKSPQGPQAHRGPHPNRIERCWSSIAIAKDSIGGWTKCVLSDIAEISPEDIELGLGLGLPNKLPAHT